MSSGHHFAVAQDGHNSPGPLHVFIALEQGGPGLPQLLPQGIAGCQVHLLASIFAALLLDLHKQWA